MFLVKDKELKRKFLMILTVTECAKKKYDFLYISQRTHYVYFLKVWNFTQLKGKDKS